jgi:hypothetical protein
MMKYMPAVTSMNRVTGSPFGPSHTVLLWDQIVSAGRVQYAFLVGVFENATKQPVLFVASEVNRLAGTLGGGSHCLGLFPGEGHANLGFSDDWGDGAKFFPKALALAAAHLGLPWPPDDDDGGVVGSDD